jgi:integral membrane protein
MFTWAGLITALILRAFDVANLVPIAEGIHGFVFLCYTASTIFVWVNQRWRFRLGLTGLLLAIIPFATVPFEIVVDRKGC